MFFYIYLSKILLRSFWKIIIRMNIVGWSSRLFTMKIDEFCSPWKFFRWIKLSFSSARISVFDGKIAKSWWRQVTDSALRIIWWICRVMNFESLGLILYLIELNFFMNILSTLSLPWYIFSHQMNFRLYARLEIRNPVCMRMHSKRDDAAGWDRRTSM